MAWTNTGNIRGPAGPQGPAGDTGPQGDPTTLTAADTTITVGGTSSARTVAANVGTASGTVAAGDDSRIANAVQVTTVDTKGDLLAGTADNTIGKLGAGANGRVLIADSAQATGLRWLAAVADLVDAATVDTDAAVAQSFRVALGGSRTLGVPTNADDAMSRIWEISAVAQQTLTLTTGSAGSFELTTGTSSSVIIPAGKVLYLGARYNSARARWAVLAQKLLS